METFLFVKVMHGRRDFLRLLGGSAAALFVSRSLPGRGLADEHPFEFLVVGDSLVWGQGLEEKDKFYSLTAAWLRKDVFAGRREVHVKVKAHSGATLKFDPKNAEKYKAAGRAESYPYPGEVNLDFPSIWNQVERAAAEYRESNIPQGADLIMLTGGITDITVEKVLDPYGKPADLPPLVEKYCRDGMLELLEHTVELNPRALIAVVGYYPMLSHRSPSSKVFHDWLVTLGVPPILRPMINNPVGRKAFFKKLHSRVIERSRIWVEESNCNFQLAVDRLNRKAGRECAIFIPTSLTEENAAEAPNTMLFRMKGGSVEDGLSSQRKADCKVALKELKRATGIEHSVRRCSLAAIGHPNPAGSRSYAEAIKQALGRLLR